MTQIPILRPLTFGLRFKRTDIPRLREIADFARGNPYLDESIYDKAAGAAAVNEPLQVSCSSRDEIQEMAAAFARLGIDPAIDELNG